MSSSTHSHSSDDDPFASGDTDVSFYEPDIDEESDSSDLSVDLSVHRGNKTKKRKSDPAPEGNAIKKVRKRKTSSNVEKSSADVSNEIAGSSNQSENSNGSAQQTNGTVEQVHIIAEPSKTVRKRRISKPYHEIGK